MPASPSQAHIQALLDEWLEVEFTFRDTAAAATAYAALPPAERELLLDWTRRIAATHAELGYQFTAHSPRALAVMDRHLLEHWGRRIIDEYDTRGLAAARALILAVEEFPALDHQRVAGALFEEAARVLETFVQGLSGRRLKLKAGEPPHTDSETLYLPPMIARLPSREENFRLYKATTAWHWAQVRFGSFRIPLEGLDGERLERFRMVEGLRLEALLQRELPGLHRSMGELSRSLDEAELPAAWSGIAAAMAHPETTAADALSQADTLPAHLPPLPPRCYQGHLRPESVQTAMAARREREKLRLRLKLRELAEEQQRRSPSATPPRIETRRLAPERPHSLELELFLDDRPLAPPEEVVDLLTSIQLDLGEIPPEYLSPAGPGEYDPAPARARPPRDGEGWAGSLELEGLFHYPEWDYRSRHYHKNWCTVREVELTPLFDGFAEETLRRYGPLVRQLRSTFEAMRDEDRLLKRQPDGDGVDIDALVEALAEARRGFELDPRLFTRLHRAERNIAVGFLVDMSGSTKGWINQAEREALLLLCEALETLDDRYAIYGFSGESRNRCEIYAIKHLDEPYGAEVRGRIGAIRPKDYTRMGFAIRHLSAKLQECDARTRMLITLSDGKPDDFDNYRGEYGIEDTRRALIETRRAGIHPYCITLDEHARDYLPHLYGPAAYTVVDQVRDLPFKVSDVYRRLTR